MFIPKCATHYGSTLAISTHVCWIINFENFISTKFEIFLNIHYYPSQYFFDLEEIIFENFNNSENNVISVELAKVLGYCQDQCWLVLAFYKELLGWIWE
jgi:hypothetical protein